MIKKEKVLLVIFPGWASFKSLYKKLDIKYDELLYFDEFEIEKFYYQISKYNYDRLIVLAWSMGTLLALKGLKEVKPDKLILLSPTLNFTSTTPSLIVKKMINNLRRNKLLTIREFCKMNFSNKDLALNYFEENKEKFIEKNVEYYINGLKLLITEDISSDFNVNDSLEPLIILGKDDQVITGENSQKVIECFAKIKVELIDCGHNVIYEGKIEKLVRSYLSD